MHQLVRKLQEWESLLNVFRIHVEPLICFHLEAPKTKTRAPEPPAGRFPKFLLPRAAGRPRELKFTVSVLLTEGAGVVRIDWNLGLREIMNFFRTSHIGFAGPGLTIGGRGAAKI